MIIFIQNPLLTILIIWIFVTIILLIKASMISEKIYWMISQNPDNQKDFMAKHAHGECTIGTFFPLDIFEPLLIFSSSIDFKRYQIPGLYALGKKQWNYTMLSIVAVFVLAVLDLSYKAR